MLTANAIGGFKNYVKQTISKAKYKFSGNYYDATITDIYIGNDGSVTVDLSINPPVSGTVVVTAIQLYDTSGNLWLETTVNIERKNNRSGIFHRITINIYES